MPVHIILCVFIASQTTTGPNDPIGTPPEALSYHGFYSKCAYFRGLPIIGSANVRDKAFRMLIATFDHMLAKCPTDPIPLLLAARSHYSIIGEKEGQTDLPEYANLRN